jgi:hypothetical protein
MFKFFKTLGMPEEEKLMHNLKLKYEELCNTEITGSTDEEKKLKQEKIDIVKQELESLHHKIRQSYITTYKKLEDTGIKRLGNGPAIAIMTDDVLHAEDEYPMLWEDAVPKYKYARNLAPFLLKAVQKKREKLVQEAIAEMSIKLDYLLADERELNIAYSVDANKEYCVRIPSENFGLAKAIAAYKKTHVTVYIPN